MEGLMDTGDSWEQSTWTDRPSPTPIDRLSPGPEPQDPDTEYQKQKTLGLRSRSLYEEYGTNEPYTKPENVVSWDGRDPESFFKLLIGPSTNFYVGLEQRHYTIPKRLLYHFSEYGRLCLEGPFSEAGANATWLPDVDPEVFQWLWRWLYTGELEVYRSYDRKGDGSEDCRLKQACQVLCQLHTLGERLLFDERFLHEHVHRELEEIIGVAKSLELAMPLTPEIVEDVLSGSAPVPYESVSEWYSLSLRPFVVRQLCNYEYCTTADFTAMARCFELDGGFAAELMAFMAAELMWVVERWGKEVGRPIDLAGHKKRFARENELMDHKDTRPKQCRGVWRALKVLCTFAGCGKNDLRAYSSLFALDGGFAVDVLGYMAAELRWTVEGWGEEKGEEVDVAAEKMKEEEEIDLENFVQKIMRRDGWS